MELISFYNVIILVCVMCMLTMLVHVNSSLTLSAEKKRWFSIAFILVAVCAIAECIGTYLSKHNTGIGLHYVITFIEFCMLPFIPVCVSFACGFKKPAKIVGIMGIIHIVIEAFMLWSGGDILYHFRRSIS